MKPDVCPNCGGPIQLWDKDTSTGQDVRTYGCDACKWSESFTEGVALWKVISDANEESAKSKPPAEAEQAAAAHGGDDPVFVAGWNKLREETFQAYLDGYNDCFSYRHTPLRYNPPLGYEKAYKAGWEARMSEEDQQLIREWTGEG